MSAYLISEVEILNEDAAEKYKQVASTSIAKYGGKYLVRAAMPFILEGESTKRRIVIVEFHSMEKLKEWYSSIEYAEALKIRDKALKRRLFFVEGIENI